MGLFSHEVRLETSKMPQKGPLQSVQVYGRKKTATAVAHCKRGNGLVKVNGRPLDQIEPELLRYKLKETSGSAARVVVTLPRSTLSGRPSPRLLLPTTRNMSMRPPRRKSKTF